jgi:HD-like signal output (HDOD) protein/ActR/RegA family two-component response regulator
MKSILFVDDEPKILNGLKRMLLPYGDRWQTEFAGGGAEALKILAVSSFDVVVADMRMPGMDGAKFLNEVARLYPQTVRMILSGTWEQDVRMQAAMVAHQYLSKPCDPEVLKVALDRTFALRDVLLGPALRALISRTAALPSTPGIYRELIQLLQKDEVSARQIGVVLAQDMGMTAKVLQLVNSAFFGLCRHITNPEDAVMFLGIDTVKALALSVSAFSCFHASQCPRFSIEGLQRHSTAVACIAREIAKSQNVSKSFLDDTFVAGLLHDVGQLVLVSSYPEKYDALLSAVAAGDRTIAEAECETFGTTHAEVGGYLLWLWGLPDPVVEAVVFDHSPSKCPSVEFTPLTAVYMANLLEHAHASGIRVADASLDTAYLNRIGALNAVPGWCSIACEQAAVQDPT